jgi:hypothetical protein
VTSTNLEVGSGCRDLALQAHNCLAELGCASYVKTIYIGYDIEGVMTAALYAHVNHIEVAISLPNDFENKILIDTSHLTWRTLPVAAIVENVGQMDSFIELAAFAVHGVKDGSHSVHRRV